MFLINRQSQPMTFVQLWTSGSTDEIVQRKGTVGRVSQVVEGEFDEAETRAALLREGYEEFPEEGWAQVVVQWPMKSLAGNKRDQWFIENAMRHLEAHLEERGLGYVDGFDRGARLGDDGGFVQNVFLTVVDGTLASTAAMSCLRAGRIDATKATIAHRDDVDAMWVVSHDRKSAKMPGDFSL